MEFAIELKDVHKSFGEYKIHKGINIQVHKNAITYIIGPSGTGKSVLLKQMCGLMPPHERGCAGGWQKHSGA
ncbi:MAG: ATP-binding cassette domain-containing protein [Geovibrio sp.]|nr:ATP-binding cassette domain-containing protein [Geovibrio sp.]MCD8568448.1 ATP-binding cassette domain-containing protein [Geovibrio sp.]